MTEAADRLRDAILAHRAAILSHAALCPSYQPDIADLDLWETLVDDDGDDDE